MVHEWREEIQKRMQLHFYGYAGYILSLEKDEAFFCVYYLTVCHRWYQGGYKNKFISLLYIQVEVAVQGGIQELPRVI